MSVRNLLRPAVLLLPLSLLFSLLVVVRADVPSGKPQAILYLTRVPERSEIKRLDTHAKFEPPVGCYLGAFIDFDGSLHDAVQDDNKTDHFEPPEFERITGKAHASYFFYLGYGRRLPIRWVQTLAAQNKFVHIALEPNNGLSRVKDDGYLHRLADDMKKSGAKIFLRFASEMNGSWVNYSKNPVEYRSKFRLVYQVMRRRAPNVALVWCPYAVSDTYYGRYYPRRYAEYYPGDDATDWVGVNMYSVTYHNNSRGAYSEDEHPCDMITPVYNRYAARKPFMICEFAATHHAAVEGKQRPDFASRKILTLYNALPRLFPRVKCINYFDSNNMKFVSDRAYNDYSVTDDPAVVEAYRYAISAPGFLTAPYAAGTPAPAVPMPVRKGERLQGHVRLSCWARTPYDILHVRYRIDGFVIYTANRPDLWECLWDAGSVKPGRHTLTLEVSRPNGKLVVSQSLSVVTVR